MLRSSPYLAALVLGLLATPSAYASEATSDAANAAPKATEAAAHPELHAAAETDAQDGPHVDTDDSYLEADFPEAKSVEVEPPLVSEGRRRRSTSYSDSSYSGSGDKDWRPEKRPKKPAGPPVTERGPFVAGALDVTFVSDRYTLSALGVTGGTYVGGRLRLAGLVGVPIDFDSSAMGMGLEDPRVLFGGSLGVALVRRPSFALSLSADVSTTDSRDLGWNLGIGLPLEWVTRRGFRVGFTPSLLRNVGGVGISTCYDDYDGGYCTSDSSSHSGIQLQGSIGMVFR